MNYLAFFIITTAAILTTLAIRGRNSGDAVELLQIASGGASLALAIWVLAS